MRAFALLGRVSSPTTIRLLQLASGLVFSSSCITLDARVEAWKQKLPFSVRGTRSALAS